MINKNNGKVVLINSEFLDNNNTFQAVDQLIPNQLQNTLRRVNNGNNVKVINAIEGTQAFKPKFKGLNEALHPDLVLVFKHNESKKMIFGGQRNKIKTELRVRLQRLSSRLRVCHFDKVSMGWLSNLFASSRCWNGLKCYGNTNFVNLLTSIKPIRGLNDFKENSNGAFIVFNRMLKKPKQKQNEQIAKSIILSQCSAIVFSNTQKAQKLVQQAKNLNIPTIGLCNGFGFYCSKNKAKKAVYQLADYPIISNSSNKNLVATVLSSMIKVNSFNSFKLNKNEPCLPL
jgi:hypothetical protein